MDYKICFKPHCWFICYCCSCDGDPVPEYVCNLNTLRVRRVMSFWIQCYFLCQNKFYQKENISNNSTIW